MKNEYLRKLNKAFSDFKFFEDGHYYEFKGKQVGISVTRFISEYANEFDKEKVAEIVATKNQKYINDLYKNGLNVEPWELEQYPTNVEYIIEQWELKNQFACAKGHTCHEFAQCLWSHELWKREEFDKSLEFKMAVDTINEQAYYFMNDYCDKLEHLADEFVIGSEEYDIASAIDHLFINKATGGLVLVDYKTNSDIYKNDKFAKDMKIPLSHLKDTKLNHYAIQLSIYRYLVEKYAGILVEEMFIVWFSECNKNYEIIEIPYLKDEVEKILENRRVKNLKSIAVLVLGKSGSGKSSSLRNLSPEEYSLVNPLSKELPFKSKMKGLESDDYKTIKTFIEKTPKKVIVIDDANYLLTNQFMRNHAKGGTGNGVFKVYNEIGDNFWSLIEETEKKVDGHKITFNFMHEEETEDGQIIPKTVGKLLNEKVCIEGLFTIVIRAMYKDGKYIFRLKNSGNDCVKTPMGMFEEEECDNDLSYIIKKIREFYELDEKENE